MTTIARTDLLCSSLSYLTPGDEEQYLVVKLRTRAADRLARFLRAEGFQTRDAVTWRRRWDRHTTRLAGLLASGYGCIHVSTREDLRTEDAVLRWLATPWECGDFPAGAVVAFPLAEEPRRFLLVTIA